MKIVYRFIDEDEESGEGKKGRPSKLTNLDLGMIEVLYSYGLTDAMIANALGVRENTIENWKKDEAFLAALKKGKEVSDQRVEKALYDRATGYDTVETDIRVVNGAIVKTDLIKHFPPDPTSMIFWLKNRKRDQWRDKQEVGLSGKDGEPLTFKVVFEKKKAPDANNGA